MKKLYVDQYGANYYASTLKELKENLSGKVSIMYIDTKDGYSKAGYVIGDLWLTRYVADFKKEK